VARTYQLAERMDEMNFWKTILAGAIVGAIGALKADQSAASQSPDPWNWKIAANRAGQGAVVGAATGALAALGTGPS
jgi:hypothetical protein